MLNANFLLKTTYENDECFECDAYEDFLEEWHNYDELRQQGEAEDFEYQLPPEESEEEEMPTEEVRNSAGTGIEPV